MASKTENYTFDLTGHPSLRVKNGAGSIHITGGADGLAAVRVTRRHSGSGYAGREEDLDTVHVRVEQQGDTITVVAESDRHINLGHSIQVDIEITAPHASRLDLSLGAGQIALRETRGPVTLKLGAGQLELAGVTAVESSRLDVSTGQIHGDVAVAPGASLDVSMSAGDVALDLPTGMSATVEASTSVGHVTVDRLPLDVSRRLVAASARGTLGGGDGHLTVRVATGQIALRGR